MKMFKGLLLFLIILLAAFLRLYKLDQFPAGLNADEAAIGYNAYSLLQTGKDEHGVSWPIHFKSFGDYKPGLYFYLVLPFVKVLGLNEWAVRLPSAILGVLGVLVAYLLTKELFANSFTSQESRSLPRHLRGVPSLAALFLAISPWHLHFSRGGWEANAATFFILIGVFLFVKGIKELRGFKFFTLSFLFFVLSMYTYHSARIIAPLLVLGLILIYRIKLFNILKWVIFSGFLAFLLLLPLIFSFFGPAGISRFSGVGFLSETGPLWRINEMRGEHQSWNALPVRLLHNKAVGYSISFLQHYFDHFHGEFLFLSGDVIERNRVPETGQMYLFEIPFVILGFYFFLKNRPKNWQIVFLWLMVSPIAAAMTFQTPHALRALNMVIPLMIITAYGLYQFFAWLSTKLGRKLCVMCYMLCVMCYFWNFARYLHEYYVHYPQTYPAAWEYGFKELVEYVKPIEKDYQKVYVTDKYDQPYILFLFYLKYPPEKFQKEVVLTPRDEFGFSTVRDFNKYHFSEINWEEIKQESDSLAVGTDAEIPDNADIIKRIYFPNGKIAFKIARI